VKGSAPKGGQHNQQLEDQDQTDGTNRKPGGNLFAVYPIEPQMKEMVLHMRH
jgi:hypothetical protein